MTTPQKKFNTILIVHLLLLKDDHILLLERVHTGRKDGYYGLVAGHKEQGEKATAAIIREAKEEIGITVKAADLHFIHVMHRRQKGQADELIDLFFATESWEGKITNVEPHKHNDPTWLPLDSLPKNIVPFIREAVTNFRRSNYFSEFFDEND